MGRLTINGTATPYMVGFGKSRKDHVNLTYKINDRMRLSYMYSGKNHSIHYNDRAGKLLKLFSYDDDEHFANFSYQDKKGWSGSAYYNYRSIFNPDYFIVNPGTVEWERSHHRQYGTEIKKVWKNDFSTTLVGVSAKRQTYDNHNQKYTSSMNSSSAVKPYAKFGPYGMNEYALTASYDRDLSPVTAAILSMRQDWVKSSAGDYSAFLPQLQVTTRLSRDSAVYASIGRFFRMPNFRNLYYASSVMVPNPNLAPEYERARSDRRGEGQHRQNLSDECGVLSEYGAGGILRTGCRRSCLVQYRLYRRQSKAQVQGGAGLCACTWPLSDDGRCEL